MLRVIVASVLVFALLVACSEDASQDATVQAARKEDGPLQTAEVPKRKTDIRIYATDAPINHLSDAPIYEGWISWSDAAFEFRACDQNQSYFVDASISILDTIDQVIQSQTAVNQTRIYVRFHGEIIAGVNGLPARYADVARITQLLSYGASVPVVCR